MPNGDDKVYKEIENSYAEIGVLLDKEDPNTTEVMKKFLSTQRIIMAFFLGTYLDDHKKVEIMWGGYKLLLFISTGFGLAMITLVWAMITGQATITLK